MGRHEDNPDKIRLGIDQIISDFEDSELQGGLKLDQIKDGEVFKIDTVSGSTYELSSKDGQLFISGGSRNIPEGTPVKINGAIGSGSAIKLGVILRGKRIEMLHPEKPNAILKTGVVTEITPIKFKTDKNNI